MFSLSPICLVVLFVVFSGTAIIGYQTIEDIIPDIKEVFFGNTLEEEVE